MIEVDWGNVRPTDGERALIEARLATLILRDRSMVLLRRRGSGFEARLRMFVKDDEPTEVRLQDENVTSAVERLVQLMTIVARERRAPAV